jgi:spermidine synthase
MALLWRHQRGDVIYEVRSAGHSLRLYTNGVLHSQANSRRGFSGGVWDLLALPALFRAPGSIRRVLLLGVGGGGVIAALRQYAAPERIIGVDIDPVHLMVAEEFFRIRGPDLQLVHDDAVSWLAGYRGAPFDMIVEDLCGAGRGGARRSVAADSEWFGRLRDRLGTGGLLVMNFLGRDGLRASAYLRDKRVSASYACAYQLTTTYYDNHVAACLTHQSTPRELRRNLRRMPGVRSPVRFRVSALNGPR